METWQLYIMVAVATAAHLKATRDLAQLAGLIYADCGDANTRSSESVPAVSSNAGLMQAGVPDISKRRTGRSTAIPPMGPPFPHPRLYSAQ